MSLATKSTQSRIPFDDDNIDVILLGVGTCGEDLALRLMGAGLNVLGIEANLVGGVCPFWGCLPSKMMIRAANLIQEARRLNQLAGDAEVTPNWDPVAARVRAEATGSWDDSAAVARFEKHGGRLIHGRGKMIGPRTVAVGDKQFTARRGVVIATGSTSFIPPIPGLSEVDFWTTREAIEVEKLPKSLIVLGGGAIGCELGQVFARFGVAVTIVEANGQLLPAEEPEAAEAVATAFTNEGIQVITSNSAVGVASGEDSIILTLADGSVLQSERLLIATGRTVDLNGLGLEAIGLNRSEKFISVDERMRVADGVWAMGDVTNKGMFTHVALYQSAIVAAELLGEDHPPAEYEAVPRVTFTDPELGSVGLTASEAQNAGLDTVVVVKNLSATFRGWLHVSDGIIKLVVDKANGTLVGATVVGPHGGEMLSMLSLAVHAGVPFAQLRSMIYAFPTFYGGIGEAIGAYGRGLANVIDPTYQGVEALNRVSTD